MKKKKLSAAQTADKRHAQVISAANRSSWQEYAVLLGADYLAATYLNTPNAFRGGCSYKLYRNKAAFHFDLANAVRELLKNEGHTIPDPKRPGQMRPISNLSKINSAAVEAMLKTQRPGNKRTLFDATVAERLSIRAAPAPAGEPDDPDLLEIAQRIDKLSGQ